MGQTIQQRQQKVFDSIHAVDAIRTLNNAQLHLINSRSKDAFFDGTDEEFKAYTDACNLLHVGKMAAKEVINPLSSLYSRAIS